MKAKTNIKAMTKPELTDEEIQSHMDFNKLLQTYHQTRPKNTTPKWIVISGWSIVITAIVSSVVYYTRNNSVTLGLENSHPVVSLDTTKATSQESQSLQATPRKNDQNIKMLPGKTSPTTHEKIQPKDSLIRKNPSTPQFTEATPIDGYPSLYAYFDKELKYPVAPIDSTQGIVTVSFAITKTGTPDLIKIENSLGKAFDVECIRVIQNMPPWKPATMYGKPVQTRLSIPLTFKIKK